MEENYKKIITEINSECTSFQDSDYVNIYDLNELDFERQLKLCIYSFLIKFKQKDFISEGEFARVLQTEEDNIKLIFNYDIDGLESKQLFKFLSGLSVRDKTVKMFCNEVFKHISHYSFRG